MTRKILRMVAAIFAVSLCGSPPAADGAQTKKIRLAFSALAYANPPFWIAHDLSIFDKYGLESEIVYVGGARPIQAMLGGSIDVSQVGGAAAVSAAAQGAEVIILGTVLIRYLCRSRRPANQGYPARLSCSDRIVIASLNSEKLTEL